MARPTSLTPDAHKRIIYAIRMGSTYELAAKYGGIAYSTFRNWCKRGEAELERVAADNRCKIRQRELRYVKFVEALKEAEGQAAVSWLSRIEKAAKNGSWQAAAWKLERRYPQDYGRRVTELSGASGGPVVIRVRYEDAPDDD